MKIAYLTFEGPGVRSGVSKKISVQAQVWRAMGHNVRHFVLAMPRPVPDEADAQFLFARAMPKPLLSAWWANAGIRRALAGWGADLIYMRQLLWWPGAVGAISTAPIVIEHNSLPDQEYRASSTLKYWLYRYSRDFFPRIAAGIVSVTAEIQRALPAVGALETVIGNGYDFSRVAPRPAPDNRRPQLLFVGASNQNWHGVDKIVALAGLIPEFDFHLVVPGLQCRGPDNLVNHGALFGQALVDRYLQADVALSTMALHRKHMQQAVPLKTREYLAYGIPVILGYEDPDLEGADYCLGIGNSERNVLEAQHLIRQFVHAWRGRALDRDDAQRRLGYQYKEAERLQFFERVLAHAR